MAISRHLDDFQNNPNYRTKIPSSSYYTKQMHLVSLWVIFWTK